MQRLTLFLCAVLLLVACGSEPAPTVAPTPTPNPQALLDQAAVAMQALQSVQFTITRSGGPAFMDPDGLLRINQATGGYAAPDSASAVIQLAIPGSNLQVQTIAIADAQWMTNVLTGAWEELPAGTGFNPAVLFSATEGWRPLLSENLSELSPIRQEELDGQSYNVLEATVQGERVNALTAGVANTDQPVTLTLWIDPATSYIHQLQFNTPPQRGDEPSIWLLQFTAFNEPVTIEPPQ